MIKELDYDKLKKSLSFLFDQYAPSELISPEAIQFACSSAWKRNA